ncbi:MAG: hypothetical protein ACYSWP_17395 [Planctomycetota bacterium]|jgi:hypothetical protein
MDNRTKKIAKVMWWIAEIWYHFAFLVLIFLCFMPLLDKKNHPIVDLINPYEELIFLFMELGIVVNVINACFLVRLILKKLRLNFFRQFAICYIAFIPIYGPFYYKKQLEKIRALDK